MWSPVSHTIAVNSIWWEQVGVKKKNQDFAYHPRARKVGQGVAHETIE